MIGMIMTSPQVLRPVISYQQAFPMMPAVAKDIIILLALGRAFLFIQIEPFSMWVLLDAFSHLSGPSFRERSMPNPNSSGMRSMGDMM